MNLSTLGLLKPQHIPQPARVIAPAPRATKQVSVEESAEYTPEFVAYIMAIPARRKADTAKAWQRYFNRKATGIREPCPPCSAGPANPQFPCAYCVSYLAANISTSIIDA